tara:strand:+ start:5252 stop:5884 length:633 start_codon:yes stop_codon:yes gene_type:complete
MQKTAIILGSTGLTGSYVLDQLITNENYTYIKLFSRKSTGNKHPKVEEFIVDLQQFESFEKDFTGDEVYCCIGTTKKKTPNKDVYRTIDVGIPTNAAQLAKKNGIKSFAVVSAIGANSNSSVGYNRMKGDMEQAVMDTEIEYTYILRPSFIAGNRQEHRGGEKFGLAVFKFLKFMIPKKYRSVEAKAIGAKMIELCQSNAPTCILESNEI